MLCTVLKLVHEGCTFEDAFIYLHCKSIYQLWQSISSTKCSTHFQLLIHLSTQTPPTSLLTFCLTLYHGSPVVLCLSSLTLLTHLTMNYKLYYKHLLENSGGKHLRERERERERERDKIS